MSLSPHIEIRIRTTPIDQSETNETSAFNKMKIAMKLCGNKTENKYWLFYLINFSTTNENRIEQKKTWYKRWNDTDTLKKKIGILFIALLQSFKNVVVLNWLLSKLSLRENFCFDRLQYFTEISFALFEWTFAYVCDLSGKIAKSLLQYNQAE